MSTTTDALTYWANIQSGALVCSAHAGAYLASAIKTKPNRKTADTPLGEWERLHEDEVNHYQTTFGYACETCHFTHKAQ
jgi:hypothetical protein